MTRLVQNMGDIGGISHTAAVQFRSPTLREAGGKMITEYSFSKTPVNGILTVDLAPGPAVVMIGGFEYVFIVPEPVGENTGIPLWPLIEERIEYEPPVVSAVAAYASQASAAADRAQDIADGISDIGDDVAAVALDRAAVELARDAAEQSATTATTQATAATGAATSATGSATAAETSAADALQSRNQASTHAGNAGTRATNAATSATAAEASQDAAATSESNAATSAATATTAREQAEQFRDQAEVFKDQAGEAATGGIPDGSLGRVKLDSTVTGSLDLADSAVQGTDPRLTDARPPTVHHHTLDQLDGFQDAADGLQAQIAGKADLDGNGVIPQAQMPAVALVDFLGVAVNQAAMLAFTGQRGDWCTRNDRGTDWQLIGEPSSTLANWREKTYPASPVSSVNGRVGAVTTSSDDITDSGTAGRASIKAETPAQGRTAIGAGTSNLAVGTGSSDAMAGNRLQVVASLPGSPTTGVWYGIPE